MCCERWSKKRHADIWPDQPDVPAVLLETKSSLCTGILVGKSILFPRRQGHFIIVIFSRAEPQSQDSNKTQKIKGHAIPMLTQEKIQRH